MGISIYREVTYSAPGVGSFPRLEQYVIHGFSWGRETGNMSFSAGEERAVVKARIDQFLGELKAGKQFESVTLIAEQGETIIDVTDKSLAQMQRSGLGRMISGDAIFTSLPEITLMVKPGDCVTAIVYGTSKKGVPATGLIHSGWRSLDKHFVAKAMKHFLEKYTIDPKSVTIGIVPHMNHDNRTFEHLDQAQHLEDWGDFYYQKGDKHHLKELDYALKQYTEAGVNPDNIEVYEVNTYDAAQREESFSYKYWWNMKQEGKEVLNGRFLVATRLPTVQPKV